MTETTGAFRRILPPLRHDARSDPFCRTRHGRSGGRRFLDRRRHPRFGPAPCVSPVRPGTGRRRPPGTRLPRRRGAPRGPGRAGRAAGIARRADRDAEPWAAPVGAGLLDRRSPTADHAGGPAAPAIRVAQLVREQAIEAADRERLAQELRVATLIQQQFLPRELPQLPEWQIAAFYGPAQAVGGDFYDFVEMPDGRIGMAVGDVTDKGVPAALVMARTHSLLRAEASRLTSPGRSCRGPTTCSSRRCRRGCS